VRTLRLGPFVIDLGARRVRRPGLADARLTPIEHRLLVRLLEADGAAVSQETLLRDVWGYRSLQTRTLATTVRRLRAKIEVEPHRPCALVTVPNVGYRLQVEAGPVEGPVPAVPGREVELARVAQALDAGRLVTLVGPPGAGLSAIALALVAARSGVRARWTGDGWRDLARAMGWPVAAPDQDGVSALVQRAGSVVVWLDREPDDPELDAGFVAAVLAAGAEVRVLLTADRPLRLDGERVVSCGGLLPAVAREMLGEGPPETLDRIAAAVDHLPVALTLVRPWVEWLGAEEVLRLLQRGSTLERADAPGLRQLVAGALAGLPEVSRSVLRALAAFADPASLQDLEALVPEASAGLPPLLDRQLVARTSTGRFRPLALVRRHVRAHEPHDHDEAYVRHVAGLGADAALLRLSAVGDREAVAVVIAARQDVVQAHLRALALGTSGLEAAARLALAAAAATPWTGGADQAAALVSRTMGELPPGPLRERLAGTWAELERTSGRSQGARAALPPPRPDEHPELTLGRASVWCGLGELEGARELLAGSEDRFPPGSELRGRLHAARYQIASVLGPVEEAERELRAALAVHEAAGHTRRVALLLPRSAVVEAKRGRAWKGALDEARRAVEGLDDTEGLAAVASAEGFLRATDGDAARARDSFLEAADRYRELGRTESALRMELDAAGAAVNLGALDEVAEAVTPLLAVVRRRGDQQAEARALFLLGEVHYRRGDLAGARAYLEPAATIAVYGPLVAEIRERLAACR
jgi:DNA-binding winged helix-turn-helix (wHTH) protein/tetratricopeptide (TPR) repeat protein